MTFPDRSGYDQAIRDVVEALRDVGGKSWTSRLPEAADFIEHERAAGRLAPSPATPEVEEKYRGLAGKLIPDERCPACGSHAPHLHPAVQHEGEVQPCADAFHRRETPENTPERIAETQALIAKLDSSPDEPSQRCDLCGGPVRAVTGDEGTSYYVPLGADRALRESVAEAIRRERAEWEFVATSGPGTKDRALADAALAAIEEESNG